MKINLGNPIYHKDFMDVSYSNFISILENAKKIFIVDLSQESIDDLHYEVYEVHYVHYSFD